MPTIYKPKKKQPPKRDKAKLIYDTVYNTSRWRKLRAAYLLSHPLCETCLKNGVVSPATDVHHIHEISNADNALGMAEIGFDADNLQALCEQCHIELHGRKMKKPPEGERLSK